MICEAATPTSPPNFFLDVTLARCCLIGLENQGSRDH